MVVLDAFGDRICAGENLIPGQELALEGLHHRFVAAVVPPGRIVFCANDYYERPAESSMPVLQLAYDDGKGFSSMGRGAPGARRHSPGRALSRPGLGHPE